MSDLSTWNVHGPVRTLRVEHAEWDLTREEWQPSRNYSISRFRSDGSLLESECRNPDGSISRSTYIYDDAGRLIEIQYGQAESKVVYHYDDAGGCVETIFIAPDGSTRRTEALSIDSAGRKTKVLFIETPGPGAGHGIDIMSFEKLDDRPDELLVLDEQNRVVSQYVFSRDSRGRLLTATMFASASMLEQFEKAAEGDEDTLAALRSIFGPGQVVSTITCIYDEAGRIAERNVSMGPQIGAAPLGGHRTTYTYNGDGVEIENITKDFARRLRLCEGGEPVVESEYSHRQHVHFEHVFDAHGNWTERVTWVRTEPNPNSQPSGIERREISYF